MKFSPKSPPKTLRPSRCSTFRWPSPPPPRPPRRAASRLDPRHAGIWSSRWGKTRHVPPWWTPAAAASEAIFIRTAPNGRQRTSSTQYFRPYHLDSILNKTAPTRSIQTETNLYTKSITNWPMRIRRPGIVRFPTNRRPRRQRPETKRNSSHKWSVFEDSTAAPSLWRLRLQRI